MSIEVKGVLSVEDVLNLQKKYVVIGATLEIFEEGESKYVKIFKAGEGKDQQDFTDYKFGLFDVSGEFEDFIEEEGDNTWNSIFGKDFLLGIYEVDFLLRVVNDGDEQRSWFYLEYENHDNVSYLGSTDDYIKELISWKNLSDPETLWDICI